MRPYSESRCNSFPYIIHPFFIGFLLLKESHQLERTIIDQMNHIWRMFEKNLCLIVKEGSIYSLVDKENGREGSPWDLYNVLTHPVYFFPPKMGPHAEA